MSTALSQQIKNGQTISLSAGSQKINVNDLVLIGGPGNEAWPIATADYASIANAGTLLPQTLVSAAAMAGMTRQPVARDRLGNIYIAGTNSSGNLIVSKYNAVGIPLTSVVLDGTATSVNSAVLFQLQSGGYACVYARAAGALYFVIFDAALSIISGPISVATEYHSTNIVYHGACALSGGGFAISFQTNAGTAINLATFSNTGTVVQAATSIQTLAGSAAQESIKLGQLSSGNLVCAFRGTMTANAIAGTSFVVVSVAGASVVATTNMDTTSTLGLLDLSIMSTGFFGIAEMNGTNIECGVYNNVGALQGSVYTVGNTLNSATYPQSKLTNDGTQFWLAWFSSVGNGLYTVPIAITGVSGTAASGLGSATINASTFALDVEIINGIMVVVAAGAGTAGQYWMGVALPDASLGTLAPYLLILPTLIGTAAATSGPRWPRVISGGAGLYTGASAPVGQPGASPVCGDFTAIFVYDQQNTASTFVSIQKIAASAIIGSSQAAVSIGQSGSSFNVNPGQGEYISNPIGGTPGTPFNHIGGTPSGTAGVLFGTGVALSGMASGVAAAVSTGAVPAGTVMPFSGTTLPFGYLYPFGQLVSRITYAALFAAIGTTYGAGDGSTTFQLPDTRGRVIAAADNLGGTPANVLGSGQTGGITGAAVPGATGGEQSHTQTTAEMPVHHHAAGNGGGSAGSGGGSGFSFANPAGISGDTGGGTAMNNTQPTIVMNAIIKY